ncbi:ComF family protein [Pseudogracilibacillus sp. SE30717A]|uniref:ComF family protein n=1 Tax=Pseudogracilibacillus sp. SE30717A TaxID=3098293 RepID=UPI00300E6A1D
MTNCLWCDAQLIVQVHWTEVFNPQAQVNVCQVCKNAIEKIKGPVCRKCSRPFYGEICDDCTSWKSIYNDEDPLSKNVSLFSYNSFMKEVMIRWKYQGDYILGEIFRQLFAKQFKQKFSEKIKHVKIVPIPLSDERSKERGFNQALELASFIHPSPSLLLERHHSEKQAKKSKIQRMNTKNPFYLKESINKPVVLVDDIYTTGRTLRHAAHLLKGNGCPKIYAYTLIRG